MQLIHPLAALLVLGLYHTAVAKIAFRTADGSIALDYADYFETPSRYFYRANAYMHTAKPTPLVSEPCAFSPPNDTSIGNANDYSCTAVLVHWPSAQAVGCTSIPQALGSISKYIMPVLAKNGLPVFCMMAVFAMNLNSAQLGGPLTTPYVAHDFALVQDDAFDVLFISNKDNVISTIKGASIDVEQQASAWNVLFTSKWYIAYVWMLIGGNILLALVGLFDLLRAAYNVTFHADVSALLISCSMAAAGCAASMLFFARTSQLYLLLETIATTLSLAAFLLMVLVWSRFLMRFDKKKLNLLPLKAVVYLALLGLVVDFSTFVPWLMVPPNISSAFATYASVIRFTSAASLIAVGLVFGMFLIMYRPLSQVNKQHSGHVRTSIIRVGMLIGGSFLTILVQTALLFVFQLDVMTRLPPLYFALTIVKDLQLTARIGVCLYIVRWRLAPPSQQAERTDIDSQPSLVVGDDALNAYPHLSARSSRADSQRWSAPRLPNANRHSQVRKSTLRE